MKIRSGLAAQSAMLSALSVVFLYLASILPTLRLALIAVAGLLPAAAVISFGTESGFFTYAVTAVLSLLLLPEKGGALLYIFFFGHYPMVKSYIERFNKVILEWVLKLAAFNACMLGLYLLYKTVFMQTLPGKSVYVVFLAGNLAFAVYDIGFSRLTAVYGKMLKKRI